MDKPKIDRLAIGGEASPPLLSRVFLGEWRIWAPGTVLAYFLANLVICGWRHLFVPDLSYPYVNAVDGIYNSMLIKRLMEGWVYFNPRIGYPFDSSLLDYPNSDALNFVLLKFYSLLSGSFYGAMDLAIVLTFPFAFLSAYLVARCFGIRRSLSMMTGLLFAFTPFPFTRFDQILLLSYFTVPLFYYFGYRSLWMPAYPAGPGGRIRRLLPCLAGLALGSLGFYNAAFGMILLAVSALYSLAATRRVLGAGFAALLILATLAGVGLNISPNIVHQHEAGPNKEVAVRSPLESEKYGLKLIQMLYPQERHPVPALAAVTAGYEAGNPTINENRSSSLGTIGSLGFLLLGAVLAAALIRASTVPETNLRIDARLAFLALIVLVLFLFGTVGGLGAIFADRVTPLIRAWNRISIFIVFGSVAAFAVALELGWRRLSAGSGRQAGIRRPGIWFAGAALAALGIADQTPPSCMTCNDDARASFASEHGFVHTIEESVPPGSAIYQLPYMEFPEAPTPSFHLKNYALASGFINSETLRWSYGGMKGRQGDLFYRSLAAQPLERQIAVLRRLGFAGIYLDRRGYDDNGDKVIGEISRQLKSGPVLTRADGTIVFFRLDSAPVDLAGLSIEKIMDLADYRIDAKGRHQASLSEPLSFAREDLPSYIAEMKGLSGIEPWGRWSDANVDPTVRIVFANPLPAQFTLVLTASAFGPNANAPTLIHIGRQSFAVKIGAAAAEYRIPVTLGLEKADTIEIVPSEPTVPDPAHDPRRIGIGLVRMRIETKSP